MPDDIVEQMRLSANTAIEVYRSLFYGRTGFESKQAVRKTLSTHPEEGGALLDRMCQWCDELLASKGEKDDRCDTIEVETTEEFRAKVDPLTSSIGTGAHVRLWPLVKIVQIGIRHCRILSFMTIADLPGKVCLPTSDWVLIRQGKGDPNQVRSQASHDYVRTCNAMWITADIARVATDRDVDSLCKYYGERFQGHLAIVCTKIEVRKSLVP